MGLLILLVLFVLTSGSRGDKSPDYLALDSDHWKQDLSIDSAIDSSESVSRTGERQQKSQGISAENEADDLFSFHYWNDYSVPISPVGNKAFSKKIFENFVKMYPKRSSSNYEENFQNEENRRQALMRRQISNWRTSDEFSDPSNIPLNIDAYYTKVGSPYARNEYSEDLSYSVDLENKNNSYLGLSPEYKENGLQFEHPQYYQKNYYYNYYPLTNSRKYLPPKLNDEETRNSEEPNKQEKGNGRKFFRKNACRRYLEFLRYAFKELDENPNRQYDDTEEYSDDWGEQEFPKNRRVFSTQLLGPTLYIDNSGKVSQINSKGNSVQMIENISPSSKVFNTKDTVRPKPITPVPFIPDTQSETDMPTTFPDLELDTTSTTTTVRPLLKMDDSAESTPSNIPEPQTLNPEIKNQNSLPNSFKQWTQTLDLYASRDRFSTTVSTDFRPVDQKTSFHNGGDAEPTLLPEKNFSSTHWFSTDDYYRRSDSAMENVTPSMPSEKTNSSVGPALYWYIRSSTPTPTAVSVTPSVNHFRSKTVVSFEDSTELDRKEDPDCNDKMLPCPDTVNVTYPLNGYCNRYVSCESGRAIRRTCPEGLHFNIITKSCDFPHNSFCTYTCPEPNGYYGIPGDCSGYFICKNSMPEYRMCPPKMHWDISKSICTFAELSSCPMRCLKSNEIRPYEGDCKAYIICLNGVPYYHKCPPNMKFDSKSQSCIPESHSKCKNDARLLTKTLNPNTLCRDVELKLGTKVWCSYFLPSEDQHTKK